MNLQGIKLTVESLGDATIAMRGELMKRVKHKLIWGWLRLLLGLAQMLFIAASLVTLLTVGPHRVVYAFVGTATAATIVSRLLYRGRPDPTLSNNHSHD